MVLESFLEIPEDSDFPINNLPYGVFSYDDLQPRCGVAISNYILDLSVLTDLSMFELDEIDGSDVFKQNCLNKFMDLGKDLWSKVRLRLVNLLSNESTELKDNLELQEQILIPMEKCKLHLPVKITDYTDFYASKDHAFNVGSMFRGPENALMPNWLYLPVGYHGRASSVIISGIDIHRPKGQSKPRNMENPIFGSSKNLDFEFEMGFFVGVGNELGKPISVVDAKDHIFGMVIVNDWSARDIQAWEYQPLGPFLAKNFATSISPWVVPLEALEEFTIDASVQEPEPFEYLKEETRKTYDIILETSIQTENMNEPFIISKSNFKNLYWSMNQMLAHHTITGCNMQTGDLLATGTISGPEKESRASLLELTWRGTEPIELPNGETRRFLEDGDVVIMKAYAQAENYRVGFGEVRTKILPSIS